MLKLIILFSLISLTNLAFAQKGSLEPELVLDVEKSVSSRTGPRTKWENIQKMHQDEVFKDGLASANGYCLNFTNDITLEEGLLIKMNCTQYDPKLGVVKDEPLILE